MVHVGEKHSAKESCCSSLFSPLHPVVHILGPSLVLQLRCMAHRVRKTGHSCMHWLSLYWYKKLENSWSCSLELVVGLCGKQTKRWLQLRVSRTCLPPACCIGVGTTCHSLEGRFLVCRSWAGDLSSCCTGCSYWLNASAQCGGSWGILGWIKHKFHSFLLIREFEG